MNEALIRQLNSLDGVKLAAVTKFHTKEEVEQLAALGVDTFAENRVQEFLTKYDPAWHWHLIGHLQTNKVKDVVGKVDLIQSVDSLRLAKAIEKEAAKKNLIQDVLVEVNVTDDPNKTGLSPDELEPLLAEIDALPHVRVLGLMGMASHTEDKKRIMADFQKLKSLYDAHPSFTILSMGMSQDWEMAVEAGSNMIRVGSALFV